MGFIMNVPEKLYHGAPFNNAILKPGIKYSKKLVKWDGTESNEFLYASSTKEEAIAMSFASLLEKKYKIEKFQVIKNTIKVTSNDDIKKTDFQETKLYLYIIETTEGQNWIKVNNIHNRSDTEYKTKEDIDPDHFDKEEINLSEWLEDKKIMFIIEKELLSMKL